MVQLIQWAICLAASDTKNIIAFRYMYGYWRCQESSELDSRSNKGVEVKRLAKAFAWYMASLLIFIGSSKFQ